ncbi:MAG: hypothetical protein IJ781_00645 [Atopobiaceae bacterium]|nr:hypothetical protein [Atopobiaceae bacterium]
MSSRRTAGRYAFVALLIAALALLLCTCRGSSDMPESKPVEQAPVSGDTTDDMWSTFVSDVELDIVMYGDKAILVPSGEPLESYLDQDLADAHFYRVVADVDYLSGGVAGYTNYPDVKSVKSITEESPDDLAIPSISEKKYGFIKLDGYENADYLLREYGNIAVLTGSSWTYRYDESLERDDGSTVCYSKGVNEAQIEAGIADGVTCCEDYLLIPAQG